MKGDVVGGDGSDNDDGGRGGDDRRWCRGGERGRVVVGLRRQHYIHVYWCWCWRKW